MVDSRQQGHRATRLQLSVFMTVRAASGAEMQRIHCRGPVHVRAIHQRIQPVRLSKV